MAWDNICTRLRKTLALLCTDVADARRLVKDAQLPEEEIDFSGSAVKVWEAITTRAEKDEMLIPLVETVLKEFPRHRELLKIERELRQRENHRRGQAPIPTLLRYSADRDDQKITLQDSLQDYYDDRSRPLIYIIHGDEYQSHDMFQERMEKEFLTRFLASDRQEPIIQSHILKWPRRYRNLAQLRKWLLQELMDKIDPHSIRDEKALNGALARHPGPVMLTCNLLTEDWLHNSPLEPFLQFWNQWPSLVSPYPLLVCFSIKYQDIKELPLWRRWKYGRLNEQIARELESLDCTNYKNCHLHQLPLLEDIGRGDVEDWARRDELLKYPLDRLLDEIRLLFKGREKLPMDLLADELNGILLRLG